MSNTFQDTVLTTLRTHRWTHKQYIMHYLGRGAKGQTHTHRHTHRQTDICDFTICLMLCYSNRTDNYYYYNRMPSSAKVYQIQSRQRKVTRGRKTRMDAWACLARSLQCPSVTQTYTIDWQSVATLPPWGLMMLNSPCWIPRITLFRATHVYVAPPLASSGTTFTKCRWPGNQQQTTGI